jgi:hypothetical protein
MNHPLLKHDSLKIKVEDDDQFGCMADEILGRNNYFSNNCDEEPLLFF